MAENLIKRVIHSYATSEVDVPDDRLVVGVEFAIAMAVCLSFLEVAHMALLGGWNSEVFATISGLTGIIIGLFAGKKH